MFMFQLQVDIGGDQEEEEGLENCEYRDYGFMEIHLSVHVVNVVKGPRTVQLHDMNGKQRLYILMDLKSIHNFLSKQTAKKLGYHLQELMGRG